MAGWRLRRLAPRRMCCPNQLSERNPSGQTCQLSFAGLCARKSRASVKSILKHHARVSDFGLNCGQLDRPPRAECVDHPQAVPERAMHKTHGGCGSPWHLGSLSDRIALERVCELVCGHLGFLASKITKQGVYNSRGYTVGISHFDSCMIINQLFASRNMSDDMSKCLRIWHVAGEIVMRGTTKK